MDNTDTSRTASSLALPPNPYETGAARNAYATAKRRTLEGRMVAVLDLATDGRGYRLMKEFSRAICAGEIHELISTAEESPMPGSEVNAVAVIGFVEFTQGGILVAGDNLVIGGRTLGYVAGFDPSHAPNHYNIVVRTAQRVHGLALGVELEQEVRLAAPRYHR